MCSNTWIGFYVFRSATLYVWHPDHRCNTLWYLKKFDRNENLINWRCCLDESDVLSRHWPENKETENIFWRKTSLLLIKASGQSNFKQHLSLFFHHLCILHSHLFLTPFSDTYTENIYICIERRRLFGGMLSQKNDAIWCILKCFFS